MEDNNCIKIVDEKDKEKLYEILKEGFDTKTSYEKFLKYYEETKNNKDTYILGYYINNNLVGVTALNVLTLPTSKEATIWDVTVKQDFRRKGIATKLMKKAEDIVISNYDDVDKLWLFSGNQRIGAHKLYRSLGYNDNVDKAFLKKINRKDK